MVYSTTSAGLLWPRQSVCGARWGWRQDCCTGVLQVSDTENKAFRSFSSAMFRNLFMVVEISQSNCWNMSCVIVQGYQRIVRNRKASTSVSMRASKIDGVTGYDTFATTGYSGGCGVKNWNVKFWTMSSFGRWTTVRDSSQHRTMWFIGMTASVHRLSWRERRADLVWLLGLWIKRVGMCHRIRLPYRNITIGKVENAGAENATESIIERGLGQGMRTNSWRLRWSLCVQCTTSCFKCH